MLNTHNEETPRSAQSGGFLVVSGDSRSPVFHVLSSSAGMERGADTCRIRPAWLVPWRRKGAFTTGCFSVGQGPYSAATLSPKLSASGPAQASSFCLIALISAAISSFESALSWEFRWMK